MTLKVKKLLFLILLLISKVIMVENFHPIYDYESDSESESSGDCSKVVTEITDGVGVIVLVSADLTGFGVDFLLYVDAGFNFTTSVVASVLADVTASFFGFVQLALTALIGPLIDGYQPLLTTETGMVLSVVATAIGSLPGVTFAVTEAVIGITSFIIEGVNLLYHLIFRHGHDYKYIHSKVDSGSCRQESGAKCKNYCYRQYITNLNIPVNVSRAKYTPVRYNYKNKESFLQILDDYLKHLIRSIKNDRKQKNMLKKKCCCEAYNYKPNMKAFFQPSQQREVYYNQISRTIPANTDEEKKCLYEAMNDPLGPIAWWLKRYVDTLLQKAFGPKPWTLVFNTEPFGF